MAKKNKSEPVSQELKTFETLEEEVVWFETEMKALNDSFNVELCLGDYALAQRIITELMDPLVNKRETKLKNKRFKNAGFNVQNLVIKEINKFGVVCEYDYVEEEFGFDLVPVDKSL